MAPTTAAPTTTIATLKLVFIDQPSNARANASIGSVTVAIRDAANSTVTTAAAAVTLTLTGGSPAGRLTCSPNPKSAVAGTVTFTGCTIQKTANGYTLTASSPGLTSATSTTFNITA